MGRIWSAIVLGSVLVFAPAARSQMIDVSPGQPAPPGMPPIPPLPPMPPQTPRTPYENIPVPAFGDPPAANAFAGMPAVGPTDDTYICGSLGLIALQRITGGDQTFAVLDPGDPFPPPIPGFPIFYDHGFQPPPGATPIGSLSDLRNRFGLGIAASVGIHRDSSMFEITGFYMPNVRSQVTVSNPSRLDLAFAKFPPPLGFEGDNNLWLQADQVKLTVSNRIINVEANYHFAYDGLFGWHLGVRYMDLRETFSVFTDDDGLILATPDPTSQATYAIASHNHILGEQLGMFVRFMLDEPDVFFMGSLKLVPAVNFNEMETSLVRGDGFAGPSGSRDTVYFSPILDANLAIELALTQGMSMRFAYQALLVMNVPLAQNQVNFDPQDTTSSPSGGGLIFFHGPSLTFQF